MSDMDNQDAWERLGELLLERRLELGAPKRAPFAEENGFKNDRVLFDLEKGRRANYDSATLRHVERAYGWEAGSIRRVLAGGRPTAAWSLDTPHPGPRQPDRARGDALRALPPSAVLEVESLPEAQALLRAVSRELREATDEWADAKLTLRSAQQALQEVEDRRARLSNELSWLQTRVADLAESSRSAKADYDLVADDAAGADHQDEDVAREEQP